MKALTRRSLLPVAVILALIVLVGIARQPVLANHFGYALPGAGGLPFRLSYTGRDYTNAQTCAGAAWCKSSAPLSCTSPAWLRGFGRWPLEQVGWVVTVIGPAHPLFRAPPPRGMTTMALYVPGGRDCYLAYALEGGP